MIMKCAGILIFEKSLFIRVAGAASISCIAFLLLIASATCIEVTAQNILPLSLSQAVDLALKNNTEIAISEYEVKSSEYVIKEARGNFLPKVNLNGNYNWNIDRQVIFLPDGLGAGGATKVGSDNNIISSLNLSLPLYSRYNSTNKEYAHGTYNLRHESQRGLRQFVTANVKRQYSEYLVAIEVVKVREKALENALANFENIHLKLLEGVTTEFDETTARVRIITARNNLLEAQNQLIPASDHLKLLLGLSMEIKICPTDTLSLSPAESTFICDSSRLEGNSDLMQKNLLVDISKRQTSLAKSGFFPTISAVGTYQFQSQENNLDFSHYDWVKTSAVGLLFQFPIFNGMVTRNKVLQAKQAEKIAVSQRAYTVRNNQAQFRKVRAELDYAKKRIEVQRENIALSEQALELVKERYHYGKGTFLEVNNAELEYVTARVGYLEAVLDYKKAYYDFELLMGIEN
jgi:outer membrane protein TolC